MSDLSQFKDQLKTRMDQEVGSLRRERTRSWAEWVERSYSEAIGKLHKCAKGPANQVMHKEFMDEGGVLSLHPQSRVQVELRAWCNIWEHHPTPQLPADRWQDDPPLPDLNPDRLRRLAARCRQGSAAGPDQWHARHLTQLEDHHLQGLLHCFGRAEKEGRWPEPIRAITVVLQQKPKGGTRPIMLFSFLYRLWARLRMDQVIEWEGKQFQKSFWDIAGRSCLDAMQEHQLYDEAAAQAGLWSASIIGDISQAFDNVHHGSLMQQSRQLSFPRGVLWVAPQAYRGRRRLSLPGSLSEEVEMA